MQNYNIFTTTYSSIYEPIGEEIKNLDKPTNIYIKIFT